MSSRAPEQIREMIDTLFREFQSYQCDVSFSQSTFPHYHHTHKFKAEQSEQILSFIVGRLDRFLKISLSPEELTIIHKALSLSVEDPEKTQLVKQARSLIARLTGMVAEKSNDEISNILSTQSNSPTNSSHTSHVTNNHFHGSISGGVNNGGTIKSTDCSHREVRHYPYFGG